MSLIAHQRKERQAIKLTWMACGLRTYYSDLDTRSPSAIIHHGNCRPTNNYAFCTGCRGNQLVHTYIRIFNKCHLSSSTNHTRLTKSPLQTPLAPTTFFSKLPLHHYVIQMGWLEQALWELNSPAPDLMKGLVPSFASAHQ